MSSKLKNSIWPNINGNLGNVKVQIPDGVTTPWPTGDALVHNFVFNKGKLVGFVDTKALIANESKSTTFPYDYVNISLPSIAEGEMAYNYDQCAYFILDGEVLKGDVPTDDDLEEINFKYMGCKNVDDIKAVDPNYLTNDIIDGVWKEGLADLTDGEYIFDNCSNLTSFTSDLSNLTYGHRMFYKCTALTSFTSNLQSLTSGGEMFRDCFNLKSFNTELPSLTSGACMFSFCNNLTTFNTNLSSLKTGQGMFEDCANLTSFNGDLSNLTDGSSMFSGCTNLTSFYSDLFSLTNGAYMFDDCLLDIASVQNIADTINNVNGLIDDCSAGVWKYIHIGFCHAYPNGEEEAAFNKIASKGWTVYVNGNRFSPSCVTCCASLTTLNETGEEITTPIPYWAKPVPSDEQTARYVDSEGNFYNILGAQFIYGDSLDTYGMFTSLDDAAAQMRLKKIGEEEIETA